MTASGDCASQFIGCFRSGQPDNANCPASAFARRPESPRLVGHAEHDVPVTAGQATVQGGQRGGAADRNHRHRADMLAVALTSTNAPRVEAKEAYYRRVPLSSAGSGAALSFSSELWYAARSASSGLYRVMICRTRSAASGPSKS
jgi:hypothetical protein